MEDLAINLGVVAGRLSKSVDSSDSLNSLNSMKVPLRLEKTPMTPSLHEDLYQYPASVDRNTTG